MFGFISLSDLVAAGDHGAAMIYHKVLKAEADAAEWEAGNPAITGLVEEGIQYAETALGVTDADVSAAKNLTNFVMGGLGKLAALDASVNPGGAVNPALVVAPAKSTP